MFLNAKNFSYRFCVKQLILIHSCMIYWSRADSRFALSQWGTALLCNGVSHWLGASLESALWSIISKNISTTVCSIMFLSGVAPRALVCEYLPIFLTHSGGVMHICVSQQTIIGSENGLSPGRCQAIIWTYAGILLIGTLGTNFSEILIEVRIFSFKKMGLKVSSAERQPSCLGLNVLKAIELGMYLPKSIAKSPFQNKQTLVQIMFWCWTTDKPLSEPLMAEYTEAYTSPQPQWVK